MKDSPMNEKISLQFMADALSRRSGVPKKVAESFIRAFFDTIVESVKEDEGLVRIDGFGTFKRVAVDSRESVNVSNGERIVIAGYNKLSFSPDDSVVEMLSARCDERELEPEADSGNETGCEHGSDSGNEPECEHEHEPERERATGDSPDGVWRADATAEPLSIDDLIEVEEPVCVERAADEFSGIDLLISTPESVDDVRRQLDAATAKVAEAIDMAKKASAEKARLERLLDRLESNAKPESNEEGLDANAANGDEPTCMHASSSSSSSSGAAEGSSTADGASECADSECMASREDAFARVTAGGNAGALDRRRDDSVAADGESGERGARRRRWLVGTVACAVVALLSCIVYFVYGTFTSIEKVEDVAIVKKKDAPEQHGKGEMASRKENAKTDSLSLDELNKTDESSGSIKESARDKAPTSAKPDKPLAAAKDEPSAKQDEPAKAKASRPTTYVVKKGETLTRIAMRMYGTKDSVKAIIRLNTLVNPNNVPAGARIKLP